MESKLTSLMKEKYGMTKSSPVTLTEKDTIYTSFRKLADNIYKNGEWTKEDEKKAVETMVRIRRELTVGTPKANSYSFDGKMTYSANLTVEDLDDMDKKILGTRADNKICYKVLLKGYYADAQKYIEEKEYVLLDPDNKQGTKHNCHYYFDSKVSEMRTYYTIGNLNRAIGYNKLSKDIMKEYLTLDKEFSEEVSLGDMTLLMRRLTSAEYAGKKGQYFFSKKEYGELTDEFLATLPRDESERYQQELPSEELLKSGEAEYFNWRDLSNDPNNPKKLNLDKAPYILEDPNGLRKYFIYPREIPASRAHNKKISFVKNYIQDTYDIFLQKEYEKDIEKQTRARAWQTKKNINKETQELMDSTQLNEHFDYIEVDNDVDLKLFEQFEKEMNDINQLLPKTSITPELRLRKLGNYHALGLYHPLTNTIAIDFRDDKDKIGGVGLQSFIHEYGHFLDYTSQDKLLSLQEDFREILNSYRSNINKLPKESFVRMKLGYYSAPTEVWARAFEIYLSEQGLNSILIKPADEYKTQQDYLPFDEHIRKDLTEYFNKKFPELHKQLMASNEMKQVGEATLKEEAVVTLENESAITQENLEENKMEIEEMLSGKILTKVRELSPEQRDLASTIFVSEQLEDEVDSITTYISEERMYMDYHESQQEDVSSFLTKISELEQKLVEKKNEFEETTKELSTEMKKFGDDEIDQVTEVLLSIDEVDPHNILDYIKEAEKTDSNTNKKEENYLDGNTNLNSSLLVNEQKDEPKEQPSNMNRYFQIEFNEANPSMGIKRYQGEIITSQLIDELQQLDNSLEKEDGKFKFVLNEVVDGNIHNNQVFNLGEGVHVNQQVYETLEAAVVTPEQAEKIAPKRIVVGGRRQEEVFPKSINEKQENHYFRVESNDSDLPMFYTDHSGQVVTLDFLARLENYEIEGSNPEYPGRFEFSEVLNGQVVDNFSIDIGGYYEQNKAVFDRFRETAQNLSKEFLQNLENEKTEKLDKPEEIKLKEEVSEETTKDYSNKKIDKSDIAKIMQASSSSYLSDFNQAIDEAFEVMSSKEEGTHQYLTKDDVNKILEDHLTRIEDLISQYVDSEKLLKKPTKERKENRIKNLFRKIKEQIVEFKNDLLNEGNKVKEFALYNIKDEADNLRISTKNMVNSRILKINDSLKELTEKIDQNVVLEEKKAPSDKLLEDETKETVEGTEELIEPLDQDSSEVEYENSDTTPILTTEKAEIEKSVDETIKQIDTLSQQLNIKLTDEHRELIESLSPSEQEALINELKMVEQEESVPKSISDEPEVEPELA